MATPDTQLFRDVFNASPIGIVVENLEGQPLFVNPAFCSMLGFSEEEIRGKHCVDFSPPEDAEKDWALFQKLRAGSKFRRVFQDAATGMVMISLESRFLAVNPAFCEFLGYSEKELVGRDVLSVTHPEDHAHAMRMMGQALAGESGSERFEKRSLHKNGQVLWAELRTTVIRDNVGKREYFVSQIVNITARKKAEEALKKSEEKFSKAFRESPLAITLTRVRDHRYIEVNETFECLTGYSRGEVLGRTPFEVGFWVNPLQRLELLQQLLAEGSIRDVEVAVRAKDDTIRVGLASAEVIEIDGEQVVLAMTADITERKRAEEALFHASRRVIEAEEQERTRIARDLHDNINQRLALLSVEIDVSKRNPPNSAEEMSRLLTELRERIAEVSSEVQSISHRLHSSQLEYLGIAAAVKSFCHEFAARQKVEIDFTQDDIPKSVPHEVSLCLFRVLQEALHNAAKHSHVRHFEVRLGCSANQLHLTVSDRGTGFDVERATNKGGLGLTSMRERVRLVNGTIAIDSKPMGGTSVQVRVPLESEENSQRAAV